MPQRRKLVHTQRQRKSHGSAAVVPVPRIKGKLCKLLSFISVQIGKLVSGVVLYAGSLITLIAGHKFCSGRKCIDCQRTAVFASAAAHADRLMSKGFQRFGRNERVFFKSQLLNIQRRAVCTHKPRDNWARNISAKLSFKAAQHRVIVKCTALHHYVIAQLIRASGSDYFIYCVFHDAYGKSRGNIVHTCAVLLCLLYGGVHKHGTAASQIDGRFSVKSQSGKLLHSIAH